MPRKIADLLALGARFLAGSNDAFVDAKIILGHVLGMSYSELLLNMQHSASGEQEQRFLELILQRQKGFPTAYLLGKQEFYGLNFLVNESTLIPRQDSESLVDHVLEICGDKSSARILDLGTGTGCLIISLLKNMPKAQGIAVDISSRALEVATQNARQLGIEPERLKFIQSNWFDAIPNQQFDIIISNPPYIARSESSLLQPELQHEPEGALFAEESGLAAYMAIASKVQQYIKPDGYLFVEIGYSRRDEVIEVLKEQMDFLCSKRDLGGHERSLCFKAKQI